jgi:hypothetical protein
MEQSPKHNPRAVTLTDDERHQLSALLMEHDRLVQDARHFDAVETRLALIDAVSRGEGHVGPYGKLEVTAGEMDGKLVRTDLPGPTPDTRRVVYLDPRNAPRVSQARALVDELVATRDAAVSAFFAGLRR